MFSQRYKFKNITQFIGFDTKISIDSMNETFKLQKKSISTKEENVCTFDLIFIDSKAANYFS